MRQLSHQQLVANLFEDNQSFVDQVHNCMPRCFEEMSPIFHRLKAAMPTKAVLESPHTLQTVSSTKFNGAHRDTDPYNCLRVNCKGCGLVTAVPI